MNIFRHGDLNFQPVVKIEGEEVKHNGNYVLAEGEHTGHKHVITCEDITKMKMYRTEDGEMIIDLRADGVVTHEEHKPITIPAGTYKMSFEREYDYFLRETRKVQD